MNCQTGTSSHTSLTAQRSLLPFLLIVLALVGVSCGKRGKTTSSSGSSIPASTITVSPANNGIVTTTSVAKFELLPSGYLRGSLLQDGALSTLDNIQSPIDSEYVEIEGKQIRDFQFDFSRVDIAETSPKSEAPGKRIEVVGRSASAPSLEKTVSLEVHDDIPNVIVTSVAYKNTGSVDILLDRVVSQSRSLSATMTDPGAAPYSMWSFHGSSEAWGKDDVMQITKTFKRENPMQTVMHKDENQTGGGLPIVAFWTRSVGEAIGSAETVPLPLAIPVDTANDGRVNAAIVNDVHTHLKSGEVYVAPLTFLSVFHGDFYEPLSMYSRLLQHRGWSLAKQIDADYQGNWCGWGYGMDFTPKQMLGTIPKLKKFGFKWATLDVRWFNNRGDWQPRKDTFPGDSIEKVVKAYHDAGIKITLWWIPVVAEDGHGKDILDHRPYTVSQVVKDHPDWLILDKDGKSARAGADLAVLCPAVPEVQQYTKRLTERFIHDWNFDGSKLDFSYTVPACYNPKHHHKSPNDSIAAMGDVYRIVLETTRALKPESVTQACPCGTPPNLAWLPFIDQAVTADPVGSKQVRERTKMYKALLGPTAAIYGDHVELTEMEFVNTLQEIDKGQDFASEVGVGAVLGTKFTWPDYGAKLRMVELTPAKEAHWKKWIDLYNAKMLSKGTFLNLYTHGYDFPEGYAIAKDGSMYYAFYVDKNQHWSGPVELRGLKPGRYEVADYESGKSLGTVDSQNPQLTVAFSEHLLLEAKPQ
jgi:alpha-galactosidase